MAAAAAPVQSGWSSEEKAENHWRRTFCQIPFVEIYEHADKGKRSLHGLVEFFRRKAQAERRASAELRELLHEQVQQADESLSGNCGSLEDLEECGTSIRKALMEVKSYVDATCNHQLLLAKVLEEQVAEPLESLQEASEMYIRILRDEIKNVNDEYAAASTVHRHAATRLQKAMEDLAEAKERQRIALHGIGVPAFELQRLAVRVTKCEDEKLQAEVVKAQAKNALYNRIIARDEMAMAVSVAYQKAEEERLDQLQSSLQRFLHVEQDRLKVAEKMVASLAQHIERIDRSEDIQLLIHNRRNPDNMHFQGKALALLDWHWGKMQAEQAPTRRRGHSIEHGVYDPSSSSSAADDGEEHHHVHFAQPSSSSGATVSADTVVVSRSSASSANARETSSSSSSHKPLPSPHGELAQSPMGLALRRYFANDFSLASGAAAADAPRSHEPALADLRISGSETPAELSIADEDAPLSPEPLHANDESDERTTQIDTVVASTTASPSKDALASDTERASAPAAQAATAPSSVVKSAVVHQNGRAMFVKCLNRQRSLETKIKDQASFDALVDCFDVFLSECMRQDDVKAAKTAMILAETFYLPKATSTAAAVDRASDSEHDEHSRMHHHLHHYHGSADRGATRMYLQEEVKRHAIWKNPAFWEKALLLAIGEELQKTPQPVPWEDLPSGVPKQHHAAVAGLPSREEAVGRVHNIVFGQLGSFTLSMLEFDVPLPQIESFVETMCDAHELTEDQRFLLRKSLQDIFATLR